MIEGDCTDVEREERNGSGLGAAKAVDGCCRWVMRAAGRRRLRGEFLTVKVKGWLTSIQRIRAGQRQATTTTARRGCGLAAVQLGCLQYSRDLFLSPRASLGPRRGRQHASAYCWGAKTWRPPGQSVKYHCQVDAIQTIA